jgi:hypothetical protein
MDRSSQEALTDARTIALPLLLEGTPQSLARAAEVYRDCSEEQSDYILSLLAVLIRGYAKLQAGEPLEENEAEVLLSTATLGVKEKTLYPEEMRIAQAVLAHFKLREA